MGGQVLGRTVAVGARSLILSEVPRAIVSLDGVTAMLTNEFTVTPVPGPPEPPPPPDPPEPPLVDPPVTGTLPAERISTRLAIALATVRRSVGRRRPES